MQLRSIRCQREQNLLRLPQRVGHEDGDLAVLDRFAGILGHVGEDLLRWRKAELRQPEGGLHDESVRCPGLVPLCAGGGAGFKIPCMQQGRPVLKAGEVKHCGSGNVTRRKQLHFIAIAESFPLTKIETEKIAVRPAKPRLDQLPRRGGAKRPVVGSKMIRVGMGHESKIPRTMRIKPESRFRQLRVSPFETESNLSGRCRVFGHVAGYVWD